jgi:hypothetical protein
MSWIAKTLAAESVKAVTVLPEQSTAPFALADVAAVNPSPNTRPDDPTIATPLFKKAEELAVQEAVVFD